MNGLKPIKIPSAKEKGDYSQYASQNREFHSEIWAAAGNKKIGGVVTLFAKTERQLIIAIMIVVGLMSGVLSNTGTAAVLIPVVIGIAAKSGYSRSRLLMPLVFAAAMGGNLQTGRVYQIIQTSK